MMCRNLSNNQESSKIADNKIEVRVTKESSGLANLSLNVNVFLPTLKVKLHSNKGGGTIARAIIDTTSHRSYVLGAIAEELDCEIVGEQMMVHLLFGGTKTKPQN